MITSWTDEEEKANAKYDSIRGIWRATTPPISVINSGERSKIH
jgi:hypothetical protein